jgi:hypothetical protein
VCNNHPFHFVFALWLVAQSGPSHTKKKGFRLRSLSHGQYIGALLDSKEEARHARIHHICKRTGDKTEVNWVFNVDKKQKYKLSMSYAAFIPF